MQEEKEGGPGAGDSDLYDENGDYDEFAYKVKNTYSFHLKD